MEVCAPVVVPLVAPSMNNSIVEADASKVTAR
jgi:hypothetical protein